MNSRGGINHVRAAIMLLVEIRVPLKWQNKYKIKEIKWWRQDIYACNSQKCLVRWVQFAPLCYHDGYCIPTPFMRGASSEVQCTTLGFGHNLILFNKLLNKTITVQSIILIKRQLCYCIFQQRPLIMWPLFTYVVCTTLYNSCRFRLMLIMSLLRLITCGLCNIKQAHEPNWVTVDTRCPPLHRWHFLELMCWP